MSYLKTFRNALKGQNFYVLDTETTGLKIGEICQIAIINSAGETVLQSLVKTVKPIPGEVTNVHGIDNDMVKDSPSWLDLLPTIKSILAGQLLVVYNAVYDRGMFHQSSERHNLPKIEWKEICAWHCAMEAYAEFYGQVNPYYGTYRWQKLWFAAQNCNVEVKDAHNALGDCRMALGVTNYMLDNMSAAEAEAFYDAYGNKDISDDLGLEGENV